MNFSWWNSGIIPKRPTLICLFFHHENMWLLALNEETYYIKLNYLWTFYLSKFWLEFPKYKFIKINNITTEWNNSKLIFSSVFLLKKWTDNIGLHGKVRLIHWCIHKILKHLTTWRLAHSFLISICDFGNDFTIFENESIAQHGF